jgi:hypothetical protein
MASSRLMECELSEVRDPSRWQRIDALLAEALTLPEQLREQWLGGLFVENQPLAPSLRLARPL